jgi:hypothetical protein
MKKEKTEKESYAKCKKGAHHFGPTADPWYNKCYNCPAIVKNLSIKIKSVK